MQMPEMPNPRVSVAASTTQDVPLYIERIGKCVAREFVSIQPQVSGRITAIHFVDGADVKAGDRLFTIDPRPYQALLDTAWGNLAQDEATLSLAKTEFARADSLLPSNAISRSDYDQAKNAVTVAEGKVKSSKGAVETAKLNLEYCEIRSPINGRAGQRLVDAGNLVTAGGGTTNTLLLVQRFDPIYADFTVAENELPNVQRHLRQGKVCAEAWLPDEPTKARRGDLTFLDNAVQESTGTVRLRTTLTNADYQFWPGQFVKVRLILETLKNAVLIPAAAVQVSPKGPYVYVVNSDSVAELRSVVLGQRQGDLVVIADGVRPGEAVVTVGHIGVTPGNKVDVEAPAEPVKTARSSSPKGEM